MVSLIVADLSTGQHRALSVVRMDHSRAYLAEYVRRYYRAIVVHWCDDVQDYEGLLSVA